MVACCWSGTVTLTCSSATMLPRSSAVRSNRRSMGASIRVFDRPLAGSRESRDYNICGRKRYDPPRARLPHAVRSGSRDRVHGKKIRLGAITLANERNQRAPKKNRIQGEHILSSTDAFFGAEQCAELGLNSAPERSRGFRIPPSPETSQDERSLSGWSLGHRPGLFYRRQKIRHVARCLPLPFWRALLDEGPCAF